MTAPLALILALLPLADGPDWIDRGRALLDRDRTEEALELFESVREREPDALEPRVWILRARMQAGHVNDALDGIDALAASGVTGPAIDYLYGMAWFEAAEAKLAAGGGGDALRRNMLDSIDHLLAATAARPDRYRDAFRPLAKEAWLVQRLDVAARAADSAAAYYPKDARVLHLAGRIAHEQYAVARADPSGAGRASELYRKAESSFRAALEVLGVPTEPVPTALVAETWLQLARLLAAGGDEAAREALASAVAWGPERIDYEELAAVVDPVLFVDAVEAGLERLEARAGRDDRAGSAYWWLGYTAFRSDLLDRAERAFVAALATRSPGLESAWYYLGRLRYVRRNWSGAVSALRASWERDPVGLFESLDVDPDFNARMIEELAGWCAHERRTVDATIFYELSAEFARTADAWQRLGRYLTYEGLRLRGEEGPASDLSQRALQTARAAFARALELAPDSPVHLVDAARHLHRVLGTDLAMARDLYERAALEAEKRLADPDLELAASLALEQIRGEVQRALVELDARGGE